MHGVLRLLAWLVAGTIAPALAADRNITLPAAELETRLQSAPFAIEAAVAARGIAEDVALKSDVRFEDGLKLRIKIRPAGPEASEFNNEPRYELAAYVFQQAFLDEPDYVVPPTALRMLPLAVLKPFAPRLRATFRGTSDVLVVLQYWLREVNAPKDLWDPARFERDPLYARHIANLNILTHLIRHGDSNAGNLLASTVDGSPRAFAVDNGVAFESPSSNRGQAWREIRVPRLPAESVERLRMLDLEALRMRLAVLATWERRAGRFEPDPAAARMPADKGVRVRTDRVQLGLTRREIQEVDRRRRLLLKRVDRGELGTF